MHLSGRDRNRSLSPDLASKSEGLVLRGDVESPGSLRQPGAGERTAGDQPRSDGPDLGNWMVSRVWALAARRYTPMAPGVRTKTRTWNLAIKSSLESDLGLGRSYSGGVHFVRCELL